MVQTVCKRSCDPHIVKRLWDAIAYIRQQKQISNTERITRYITREYGTPATTVHLQLEEAVEDNLIDMYTAVGSKGSKVGVEQDGFKVRDWDPDYDKGNHDWYCFVCHKAGEVLECSDCWRVYHPACVEGLDEEADKFTCYLCEVARRKPRIKRKTLNRLLAYTSQRLREKTRELHKLFSKKEDEHFEQLVFMPMDLNTMEEKTSARRYKYLQQFEADTDLIYHNIYICYGAASPVAELAKMMIKDCKYDLEEIDLCKDCYYYSNAKPKDWFCQPCRPSHDLVYAKQKGFSYWPAKVIQRTKEGADVRFFGGWHQRAIIPDSSIKPIDSNLKSLNIKKTAGFNKAVQEMKLHRELMENASADPDDAEEADEDDDPIDEPIKVKRPRKSYSKADKNQATLKVELEDVKLEPSMGTVKIKRPKKSSLGGDEFEVTEKKHGRTYSFEEDGSDEPPKKRPRNRVVESASTEDQKPPPKKRQKHRESTSDKDSGYEISSTNDKQLLTPEDANMVTSSEDNCARTIHMTETGTQTAKKFGNPGRMPSKGIQTDLETECTKCSSDSKTDHEAEKDKALKELTEKLRKEFEVDKQQAVARAMSSVQREKDRIAANAEEQCREKYMEEMKKLAAKHKSDISAAKKKQWCYFCEEEAMYHCCWNTSYCSNKCQQEHWQKEHKRLCRRKR